jgi:hypothetical protein
MDKSLAEKQTVFFLLFKPTRKKKDFYFNQIPLK